ncbi:hypothetical protein FYJ28_07650 [Arthrobacter sp. BL-252-APC-1A]|uniref:hypothetical protein n=1 Tax=Arthrobacter sp. BL-252-APC-1A TaxID=2606622 RepID=UPI0012B37850|nr:hypothetical protein [Arthrobacter sp. BL-252-APC-1A]MSR98699.1 hypothetical protein [Arthrobacter sp. BL-252-APC-1A]
MIPSRRTAALQGARIGLAALTGGMLAAAFLATAPSAQAAEDYLQVSLDGTTFGTSTAGAVFTDGVRLVPGTSNTARIWVRNAGPEAAFLTVAAFSRTMHPELSGHLSLAADPASVTAHGRTLLGPAGTCTDLDLSAAVPAGTDLRLDLAAGLAPDSPNTTMNKRGSFDLVFLLDAAGDGTRSACDGIPEAMPPIQLPQTGGRPVDAPDARAPGVSTLFIQGTPAAAAAPAGPPVVPAAQAEPPAQRAEPPAVPGAPADVEPASFIESTVEPIIRTWQGTLMVLLTVGFFAAAAVRTRISRRTAQV